MAKGKQLYNFAKKHKLKLGKIEDRELGIGEMSTTIRDLYFDWCKTLPKIH